MDFRHPHQVVIPEVAKAGIRQHRTVPGFQGEVIVHERGGSDHRGPTITADCESHCDAAFITLAWSDAHL